MNDELRDAEAAGILHLLDAPSVGPRRAFDLLRQHRSAAAVREALLRSSGTPDRVRVFLASTPLGEYERSIATTHKLGARFILWCDDDYPVNLGKWDGRPPVLFYLGDMTRLGERALALVGRVDPTEAGLESASRFARKCVDNDITVVSGLAKGIDGASHASALHEPPGVTYAVVGHGIDHRYPRENVPLYERIPSHGAIISQFRTGFAAQRWTFPARNEVMCTLALGTVIIEGKEGCGSIIQADFSFKHGRPVFLLSRNLELPDPEWAHALVKRGAHVIEHFDQVLDVVERTLGESWRQPQPVEEPLFELAPSLVQPEPAVAVLFDLDGVVVDTREATAAALASIAERHTGRSVDHAGMVVAGAPHRILASLGVRDAYNVYKAEYDTEFENARGEVRVFEDVVEGLVRLKEKGVRLAAVTAQPRRRAETMLTPEVRNLFELFYTYNETRGDKSVGITKALRALSVDAGHAMYIGDTSQDLEAARRAGVKGVGVLWGFETEEQLRRWPHDLLLVEQSEVGPQLVDSLLR